MVNNTWKSTAQHMLVINNNAKQGQFQTDAIIALQWLGFHSSWTPSHYETESVIFVKMP
jgi:hypothetical protein